MMNSRERRKAEAKEHNKKRDLLEQYSKLRREIALNKKHAYTTTSYGKCQLTPIATRS